MLITDIDKAQRRVGRLFNTQVVFGTAFLFLTSGVFLSGFAIYMGASDLLVSYISMITNICGVSILFFSSIIERFSSFKKVTISLTIISKLATLLIVLIPLIIPSKARIAAFVPMMVLAFTMQAQTTVLMNNWLVNFVDEKKSGRYIAKRQTFVLSVNVLLALAGGRFLDSVSGAYIGFLILFLVAFIMSVAEVVVLLRIPDAVQHKPAGEKIKFTDMIKVPIKCKPFLYFVVYVFLFYLMLSIADSFTIVFMMRYLELPYITITAMQMIISLPQIFLLGIWGKISDKKGHQFALITSIWFFVGETVFLALTNSQNFYVLIPISFLFAAVANAGFVVSVFNRRYELMLKEGRVLYDNFFTAAVGLAFILGPVTGGAIKQLLESSRWVQTAMQFGSIRILYLISTVLIIILQVAFTIISSKENKSI